MKRLATILLLTCVLFVSPVNAILDMQSNAVFFDGKGHGDQVINGLLDLIYATKSELLIQMYGFSGHNEVEPIFNALKEASLRNVQIKIYLSQDAGRNNPNKPNGFPEKELQNIGIEVRWKREQSIQMHRKLWLSDNCTVFIGSSNISDNSFNSNDEIDLRIQDGQIASKIREVFFSDWQNACEDFDCTGNNLNHQIQKTIHID